MIELKQFSYQIGSKTILDAIDWQIETGCFWAVLGANGAGKSTLLRGIAGDYRPTSGQLSWDGDYLASMNGKNLATKRGILSQHTNVAFPMTVEDVVSLGRYPYQGQCSPTIDKFIIQEVLEYVGLSSFSNRIIQELSGGEKQRVHFARVLAQIWGNTREMDTNKVLLLDEPTSSLDIAYQHELLALARQLAQAKQFTVVAILHDMNLAAQYADQLLILKKGNVSAKGTVKQVLSPTNILEAFGVKAMIQTHPIYDCPQVITYHSSKNVKQYA